MTVSLARIVWRGFCDKAVFCGIATTLCFSQCRRECVPLSVREANLSAVGASMNYCRRCSQYRTAARPLQATDTNELHGEAKEPNSIGVDSLVVRLALPGAIARGICSRSVLKFDPLLAFERRRLLFSEGTQWLSEP